MCRGLYSVCSLKICPDIYIYASDKLFHIYMSSLHNMVILPDSTFQEISCQVLRIVLSLFCLLTFLDLADAYPTWVQQFSRKCHVYLSKQCVCKICTAEATLQNETNYSHCLRDTNNTSIKLDTVCAQTAPLYCLTDLTL